MNKSVLYEQINLLPDELKEQVADYVKKLVDKKKKKEPDKKAKIKFGSTKGIFIIKPGFDDPIEGFEEYT
jgi:hypothetical protein